MDHASLLPANSHGVGLGLVDDDAMVEIRDREREIVHSDVALKDLVADVRSLLRAP